MGDIHSCPTGTYDETVGKQTMDRIMSNEKMTISAGEKLQAAPKADDASEKKKAKVVSLSIDDNDDFGGDPYNHTGSHAVPDFGQDD